MENNIKKNKIFNSWTEFERFFGGLKWAVTLIVLFALAMIAGTLTESYFGADFAARAIYKTWPFMLLQFFIYLSIILATLVRLPPKKRLYGFYTVHLGLIVLGAGSFATYIAGIDGQVTLTANNPTRELVLSDDVLTIARPEKKQKIRYTLPSKAFATKLNDKYQEFELLDYFPFAGPTVAWKEAANTPRTQNLPEYLKSSGQYFLSNGMMSQDFVVSLNPEVTQFPPSLNLGPLTINYLPAPLLDCIAGQGEVLLWNVASGECIDNLALKLPLQTTKSGNQFLVYPWKQDSGKQVFLTFFPAISPVPMNVAKNKMELVEDAPFRVLSKKAFMEGGPQLILAKDKVAFYDKNNKKWSLEQFTQKNPIDLPWMGFQLKQIKSSSEMVPYQLPVAQYPAHKNGELIKGQWRALKIAVDGKEYWATNQGTTEIMIGNEKVYVDIGKETKKLPFEFVLKKFKMDTDPGTNNPASYESFVQVFSNEGPKDYHIFMNNPLKYMGMTFYQASYFQDENGNYGSVLSANIDPGRVLKYLGAILLVCGAIWHYRIRRQE